MTSSSSYYNTYVGQQLSAFIASTTLLSEAEQVQQQQQQQQQCRHQQQQQQESDRCDDIEIDIECPSNDTTATTTTYDNNKDNDDNNDNNDYDNNKFIVKREHISSRTSTATSSLSLDSQNNNNNNNKNNTKSQSSSSPSSSSSQSLLSSMIQPPLSYGEQFRDAIFRFLNHPVIHRMTMCVILLIIADGAFFFFLLMGWQLMCRPTTDCASRNYWYNWSVHVLNGLMTYMAIVNLPWRVSNFLHLTQLSCCSPKRTNHVGYNLYGLPIGNNNDSNKDIAWFCIPKQKRLGITICLLCNCFCQFINQGFRIEYNSYEKQSRAPGNIYTSVFFGCAFIFMSIGGIWYLYELSIVRKQQQQQQQQQQQYYSNNANEQQQKEFALLFDHRPIIDKIKEFVVIVVLFRSNNTNTNESSSSSTKATERDNNDNDNDNNDNNSNNNNVRISLSIHENEDNNNNNNNNNNNINKNERDTDSSQE